MTAATPLRTLAALYDYVPARDPSTGQLENDEEMEIQEGEYLDVMDEPEDEWILVQRANNGGCGFVPASYVGVSIATGDRLRTCLTPFELLLTTDHSAFLGRNRGSRIRGERWVCLRQVSII